MKTITRKELKAKGEKVDKLWQAAHAARIKAAKEEEEYRNMQCEYYSQHERQKE